MTRKNSPQRKSNVYIICIQIMTSMHLCCISLRYTYNINARKESKTTGSRHERRKAHSAYMLRHDWAIYTMDTLRHIRHACIRTYERKFHSWVLRNRKDIDTGTWPDWCVHTCRRFDMERFHRGVLLQLRRKGKQTHVQCKYG